MPPDWFDDVRPMVKEGVRSVIERHEDVEADPPTQTFHQLTSGGLFNSTEAFTVPAPGDNFQGEEIFDNLYNGEFTEAAEFIYHQFPDPPDDHPYSEERDIESTEQGLFEFVGVVLNYVGEMEFDDSAFDAAFNEQFEPRFTDREYSRFLLCLKNTRIERGDTINLETDIRGSPDYLGPYGVDTLQIRPLDELEEVGIATHEAPIETVLDPIEPLDAGRPNAALEIVLRRRRPYKDIAKEFDGTDIYPWKGPDFEITPIDVYPWQNLTEVIRYIATSVRRCIRLLYPVGTVGYSKGYQVTPGWKTYRGISTPVTFAVEFDCPDTNTGTVIAEDRALEMSRFWDIYRDKLSEDEASFQKPLARFERMFSRESLEDQLVDCVVGCETTLLKGGSPGGNRYRLGVRAAILLGEGNKLDWPPKQIGEFFRTLYRYRNEVVHRDEPLPDEPSSDELISVGDDQFLASTFLVRARQLYADVVRQYLGLTTTQEMSIYELNQRMDDHVLDHGREIQEQSFTR